MYLYNRKKGDKAHYLIHRIFETSIQIHQIKLFKSNQAIYSRGSRVTALSCTVLRLKAKKSNQGSRIYETSIQIHQIKLFKSNQAIFSRGSRVTALSCTVLRLKAKKSNQAIIGKDIKGPIIGLTILFCGGRTTG